MVSKRIAGIEDSPTLAISAQAGRMKKQGIDVVDFGAGQPDFEVPQQIRDAAKQAIDTPGSGKYTASDGMPELKQAIIEKFMKDNGIEYAANQILVSPGAKFCLYAIIMAAVDEGDEVIIPRPYWVSYPEMVKLAGGKAVFVDALPKDGFVLKASAVKKAVTNKTTLIIINSPNNPTGAVYPRQELERITEIAAEKTIHVISDEIYEKMIYDDAKHESPASFSPECKELVFTVNGMSKSHAIPGWRLGYAAGPQSFMHAAMRLQSHTTSNPASIVQMALQQTLLMDGHTVAMRAEFAKRRDLIVNELNKMGFETTRPGGAFYVFPKLPKGWKDSQKFCEELLKEKHVAATPGLAFGMDGFVRLSYATSMDGIRKGLERIGEFIGKSEQDL